MYEVLHVQPAASQKQIASAFKRLALRHHPDKRGADPEQWKAIYQAHATLGDPALRVQYDSQCVKHVDVRLSLEELYKGCKKAMDGSKSRCKRCIGATCRVCRGVVPDGLKCCGCNNTPPGECPEHGNTPAMVHDATGLVLDLPAGLLQGQHIVDGVAVNVSINGSGPWRCFGPDGDVWHRTWLSIPISEYLAGVASISIAMPSGYTMKLVVPYVGPPKKGHDKLAPLAVPGAGIKPFNQRTAGKVYICVRLVWPRLKPVS